MSSRSSLETRDSNIPQDAPVSLHSSLSDEDSAYRVRSFASSLPSSLSRVATLGRAISSSIRDTRDQIRTDNAANSASIRERQRTQLGREMSNMGLESAIRVATYKSQNADALRKRRESAATAGDKEKLDEEERTHLERIVTGAVDEKAPPRDVGYAWVMAAVGFMVLFSTWGANGAYGVFLSYWLDNSLFPGGTSRDYALIGSIVLCLAQSLAPLAQMLSAIFGIRPVMIIGSILQMAGYLMCSWATTLWQLYLTAGVCVGFGFALVFNPPFTLIPDWFDKHRGISSGITVCASGVGGVLFALTSQKLIDETGTYKWSLRMMAIISFAINILVIVLTRARIPQPRLRTIQDIKTRASVMFNFKVAKLWYVQATTIWFMLVQGCYIITLFSLSTYCTSMGYTQTVGSDMTAIFNGCQAIGRFSIGLMSDYTGRTNLAVVLNIVMVILTFAMWINAFSYVCILFFTILAGLTFGVASTLNQPILADETATELFPSAWSLENFFMGAWCLAVEVIALKLRVPGARRPFLHSQIAAGCFSTAGFFFLLPLRELKINRFLKEQLTATEKELSDEGLTDEETQELNKKLNFYKAMLGSGPHRYFQRLTYPIKV